MTLSLTPEEGVLVRAAVPPGSDSLEAPPIPGAVRWDRLLELAAWHRLTPLVWRYLRGDAAGIAVPIGVMDDLHQMAMATTARNLNLQVELDRVLAVMASEEIPVMLLKGAALIESVYPQIGLRPMDDLDLLVPRSSIQRAQDAVAALGFDVWGDKINRDEERRLATSRHHFPLVRRAGAVCIELHHHVTLAAPGFDIHGYWDRALPGVGKVAHLLPEPEDLLLHVAIHFSADRIEKGNCGLGQLADLAWIADHFEINWDALARRARFYGVGDRLFLALLAASRLLGDVAPPKITTALQPASFAPALGDLFLTHLVLRDRPPLPQVPRAHAWRRLYPARDDLGFFVRSDEAAAPSLKRLHLRRARSVVRNLVRAAPWPRELLAHIRVRRWIGSLR